MLKHQMLHFRNHIAVNGLPAADASHAVRALCVVTEAHVLTQGHHSLGVQHLWDVHTGRMHLTHHKHTYRNIVCTYMTVTFFVTF